MIKEWYVQVGDTVNQFDKICEVQSDKASVTITSRFDGKITKLFYEVDDTANVGAPLVELVIDTGKDILTQNIALNFNIYFKKKKLIGNSASIDKVDDQDLSFQNTIESTDKQSKLPEIKNLNHGKILTTPAVRKIANEHNINLSNVIATGKDGRILKEDVLNYIENKQQTIESSSTQKPTKPIEKQTQVPQHVMDYIQQYQYEPLTNDKIVSIKGIQKAMFKTMTNSLSIPHFGLSDEIDLTKLVQLREEMKSLKDDQDVKITYLPFFVKAASLALSRYPILNSSIDETGENLIYKSQHNIGIAIDTNHGLIVATIKSVNQRSIKDIATEMIRLQDLANKNQLSNDDLSGATFTLSNIGSVS